MSATLTGVRAFWRWLAAPRLSIADGLMYASVTLAADALKLSSGLPWPFVLAVVLGVTVALMFGAGFVKGFARSVAYDVRQWRAGRRG